MSFPGPAPPGAAVAVLEKRGRFLVGVPLFPPPRDGVRPRQLTVRPGGRGARPGSLVLLAPQGRGGGQGRVVREIGRPDVARDVIEALMLDRGLRRGFEPVVDRAARAARDGGLEPEGEAEGRARRDLRELPTFTIDPAAARDFDDAISARREQDGAVRVWVHIADVAAYVPAGSAVDREARRRATSVYVPGAVEPMLPEALSNDACSLVPGRERLTVTVEMLMRGEAVESVAFYRSVVRSDARLVYEQVDRIFAGEEAAHDPWGEPLAAARGLAGALEQARVRRGALTLDQPEPEFVFSAEGHLEAVLPRRQTESHRLIEHLMIAANEQVARRLGESGTPCLYRVHERPDPARVQRLVDQLASLEVATPPVPRHLSPSQAAELVGEISRLVEAHVRRTGRGRLAFGSLVLRSLKQAYYSPQNLGHAGLGSSAYCHFTSPIRRYPDLVCHRALLSLLGAGEHAPRASAMAELGEWTSDRERAAMVIERDADDVARCFALERVLFEEGWDRAWEGEVTGVIGAGAFLVFGEQGEFEGMLPVRRMRGEWWELSEEGTILHGTREGGAIRLGDPLRVRVHRVEAVRGRVDLEPGDGEVSRPAGAARRGRRA